MEGRTLTFHLAGINNQNFLMRDEETGSFWQQVTGLAISGPLKGAQLEAMRSDELSFALWKTEAPAGTVLAPVAEYLPQYASRDWEAEIGRLPVVVRYPDNSIPDREIVMGMSVLGGDRAYFYSALKKEPLVQDRLASVPVMVVLGPDGESVRAFSRGLKTSGAPLDFFRKTGGAWALVDSPGGSEWDFQGCAVSGPAKGHCLEAVPILKDYWFDWKQYHPDTTVYKR